MASLETKYAFIKIILTHTQKKKITYKSETNNIVR